MTDFDDEPYMGKIDIKGAFTGSSPGDRPLLEELSIDLNAIKSECLLPLKVLRTPGEVQVSSDIAGPVIVLVMFTLSLVLQGKLHFGYIYLISLTSTVLVFGLLNLLTHTGVSYAVCCNAMGYSMTPVVAFSFLNTVLAWAGRAVRASVCGGMCLWSAYVASRVLCQHLGAVEKTGVVSYPLFLAYISFGMMVIF